MKDFGMKVEKTLRHHSKNIVQRYREFSWDPHQSIADSPVFVVGCSRAGTTLVYKTLSESPELSSLQRETHDFWADLHPISNKGFSTHGLSVEDASDNDRQTISRYFYGHTGSLQFVDKNNQNGLCVGYLHKLFPNARFVYVKRSPGDNIHSLIQGWGKANEFATWSSSLPVNVAVENGKYKRWCFFITEGWKEYLNSPIEEVCAFQYQAMNEAILDAKEWVPKTQWHEIAYETLIDNPTQEFEKIFKACDLPFDHHIKLHCEDVLYKPYNTFSEIRVDKWKDGGNKKKIDKILPGITEIIIKMGY
mgnify:CR=1 FL=1